MLVYMSSISANYYGKYLCIYLRFKLFWLNYLYCIPYWNCLKITVSYYSDNNTVSTIEVFNFFPFAFVFTQSLVMQKRK